MNTASAPTTDETSLSARETVRALYTYVRPHRWAVALGLLCALVGAAGGLLQPLATKALVDRLASGGTITGILIALTVLVVLGTAVEAFGAYVLERTAESVVLAARRTVVGRLLRLRIAEWERIPPGDLMSRVTSDTTLLRAVSTQAVVSAATGAVAFVAAVVMMAFLDVVLLGVTLGVVVLVGGATLLVMPRIARATERSQEAVGEISVALERAFGAFRTVKASGAEARETARVDAAARRAWRHGVKSAKWEAVAGSADELAVQLAFLAVLGVGGARVASGEIPVSTLIAFLLYLFYLIEPVSRLVEAVSSYQEGAAAISRITQVDHLATEPANRAPVSLPEQGAAASGPASVRFEDVSFRYRSGLPHVHQQVSFEVPGSGTTAFVGPSGAGKSTVFALIERFHEATGGRILVDGKDVRDWSLAELRSAIGYVEQDAPVLAGTLRENLVFAAPGATDDDIREVLDRTRLDALVERLPHGLDTPVGHRGSKLSGGERQRVAIARALLRRPRLLLLDEATSQLDAVNELALRDVITEVARETTVLVVAHRLSTVTGADRIVVMDAGRVRAVGTHEELVTEDPLYAQLAATQLLTPAR
ncbi:ABC transporter ATP-binding protein [Streptomyces scabiei]|uniref:ABC transporter ATP-binding protein n=1 Tax=Streptomyces scabiei TaxID=1930 RepID=UPI001B309B65|nr:MULTISPECIES: ABC transporter ATP-binding protein [Streptomyces]MBP5859263.1 ABC transporter ATP-binding protein [Streptomyces sp. LBUM 1484]MBP5880604.1 ABC transporter ATP-binding protein [Streptomyces sp. LBUM 1477]MBP5888440.1 ABC transporter ATP-binding protein [Streptomyces sp. LBUM 1487]MBP5904463.1 ABC transporter ATP-binding protein [Streptomyces sp. LBUM 1488]MDX2625689.1 ABC transporter ATP-binding protein [Streptomyces scabiei]